MALLALTMELPRWYEIAQLLSPWSIQGMDGLSAEGCKTRQVLLIRLIQMNNGSIPDADYKGYPSDVVFYHILPA